QCELSGERYDAAAGAFERVLSLGKDYLREPATWMLGEARFRAKDYTGAQKQYAAVLSIAPSGTYADDAACGLAWCSYRLGKPAEALDRIQTAIDKVGDGERRGLRAREHRRPRRRGARLPRGARALPEVAFRLRVRAARRHREPVGRFAEGCARRALVS